MSISALSAATSLTTATSSTTALLFLTSTAQSKLALVDLQRVIEAAARLIHA